MKIIKFSLISLVCLFFTISLTAQCTSISSPCGPGQGNDFYCMNLGGEDPCLDCGCYRACSGESDYCFA